MPNLTPPPPPLNLDSRYPSKKLYEPIALDSSGSRISRGVSPTPEFRAPTYYLARFLRKSAWKWKKFQLGEGTVPSGPLRCANGLNPWIVDQNGCYKRPNKLSISKKNRTKMCFRTFWATNFLELFSNFVLVHRINWKICQPNLETKNAISREYWPFQNWNF